MSRTRLQSFMNFHQCLPYAQVRFLKIAPRHKRVPLSTSMISRNSRLRQEHGIISTQEGPRDMAELILIDSILSTLIYLLRIGPTLNFPYSKIFNIWIFNSKEYHIFQTNRAMNENKASNPILWGSRSL